jgi:hypothetical protein
VTPDLAVARTCRALTLATLTTAGWLAANDWPWWLVAVVAWPAPSLLYLHARSRHHTRSST